MVCPVEKATLQYLMMVMKSLRANLVYGEQEKNSVIQFITYLSLRTVLTKLLLTN